VGVLALRAAEQPPGQPGQGDDDQQQQISFMAVGFDSRSFPSRADGAIEQFGSDNRELNTNMTAQPKIVQDAVALADQISRALS
jgi:hypothetical protein